MPGKEIIIPTIPTVPADLSLLKAHKVLPKRQTLPSQVMSTPVAIQKVQTHDIEREGYSSSERIRSWIPEPSSIQPIPEYTLPLTPPMNAAEKRNGTTRLKSPSTALSGTYGSTHTVSSSITSPVLKQSPPTPETTPPKRDQYTHISRESSNPRFPSTRAESFETARENQTSDEDMSQPDSPSLRPARQKWLKSAGDTGSKSIGLGLGLDLEDGEQTPTEMNPNPSPDQEDLIYFDGAWNGATPEIEAVKGGADLTFRSELRKRLPKRSEISNHLLETPLINGNDTPSTVTRSLSLQQRLNRNRDTPPHTSAEDLAEAIRGPLQDDSINLNEKLREVDDRRFSQISTSSTTVEAVIFSTPQKRRRTLRHSSKFTNLNNASAESECRPPNPSGNGHQRLLRHAKSPSGGQRASFVSGMHDVDDIHSATRKQGAIPSTRPTTAPEEAIGYFDLAQPNRRTVSAYVSDHLPKGGKITAQKTPPSNASLDPSPPANKPKAVSRANSNASAERDSISPPTRRESRNGYGTLETPNAGIASPDEASNGDWSALRPRSSLVTPFSLRSARSSTPGTLEVNEATAISIYPHTNRSILVVQHAPRRNSQPAEHSAVIASNAKFAIPPGTVQPPVIHEPRRLLDSPLQNPRSPPQPPDFKIIPPTPANVVNDSSSDRQQVVSAEQTPKRRLSNRVKRAFSARRYSDAFVAPLTRSFSLSHRNTATGGRPASIGLERDRNLHPLWRPRAFWDSKSDESDSDSDFGNDGFLVGNSLGMPTEGVRTFDPPRRRASLSNRLGSLRLLGRRRTISEPQAYKNGFYDGDVVPRPSSPRRLSGGRSLGLRHKTTKFYRRSRDNASYEFIQPPHSPENIQEGGGNGVPRLGYQVQFVGFKGLAEKVKERREEARREKVRQRLKGSIDVLRGV